MAFGKRIRRGGRRDAGLYSHSVSDHRTTYIVIQQIKRSYRLSYTAW